VIRVRVADGTGDHDSSGGWPRGDGSPLVLPIPDTVVEVIAEHVARLLAVGTPPPTDPWPEWMSVETAARYLDVSPERIRKLLARGELPYYQAAPGCRILFRRSELDDSLAAFRRGQRR
jgi:excisionase family DNA binding protein